jgi:hypothetical protein
VHEEGFQVERLADGELEFRHPCGWVLPQVPATPPVSADAEAALRAQNAGVRLDAQTLKPAWGGERFNVAWAIDCLHPRAIGY